MTRFSRVTFNAAHRYLGLTTEVLRTEKAINDIACHPLPASFYEGGGLQYLRHRFDGASANAPDASHDYFNYVHSPSVKPKSKLPDTSIMPIRKVANSPLPARGSHFRGQTSRHLVQAGDLHSSTGHASEVYRPLTRSFSILNTPRARRSANVSEKEEETPPEPARLSMDDFDLREEVMSCIAKSIGLLQPPLSGSDSVEASPAFPPSDGGRSPNSMFGSSFGSLSLLDIGDDSSSTTGGDSSIVSGGNMSGLDNEVEILFFAAGSTLARAGERNTGAVSFLHARCRSRSHLLSPGLFYVIEGFLDILLPVADSPSPQTAEAKPGLRPGYTPEKPANKSQPQKLLFTVKPGGIAGYLGTPI